jgi:hypothetical protein
VSTPRTLLIVCAIIVWAAVIHFGNSSGEKEHRISSISEDATDNGSYHTRPNTFASYECTQGCSGHEAGYAWAEEHDISDGEDCVTAGEHSNSPSFSEGCHAYVDGDTDSEENVDSDDEN